MHFAGHAIIIVLSLALLLGVEVLLFGLGKIGYGIAHYYLRGRKPERRFQHPQLGPFISDDTLWTCVIHREGREIRLAIGGTDSAPSAQLLEQAQSILTRFDECERRALEFLRSAEAEVRSAKLDLYALEITDDDPPGHFTFEFLDERDDGVWRVEHGAGEPKYAGFED